MKHKNGYSLIETLTATALLAIILTTFLSALASLGIVEVKARLRTQAVQLARENMEIAYNLSVQNWEAFAELNGSYILDPRSTPDLNADFPFFELGTGIEQEVLDRYDRTLIIEKSRRNDQGDVIETGSGEEDETTMKVTSIVSWEIGNTQQSIELVSYMTDVSALSI